MLSRRDVFLMSIKTEPYPRHGGVLRTSQILMYGNKEFVLNFILDIGTPVLPNFIGETPDGVERK